MALEARVDRLEAALTRLAEVQVRSEERFARLEEAQIRTEEHFARLEEAQARTEARVEQLAAAQERTERAVQTLAQQVGRLADTIGFTLEDLAREVTPPYLAQHYNIHVSQLDRHFIVLGD